MKKCLSLLIIILFVFSILVLSEKISATVGGPIYISQIAYDASNNSVYYLEKSYGGMGCPPIIHRLNLTNNQTTQVKTCAEVFQEYFGDHNEENNQKYEQFISDLFENFSSIHSVSLKKNNIDVNVSALSEDLEFYPIHYATKFRAVLTQDDKEVAKIDFSGCHKEQPNIFEGYKIPDSDAMLVLISNHRACFESGYVAETLHLVRGIKYYDTEIVRSFKESSATEPNLGNLIVYASSQSEVAQSIQQNQLKNWTALPIMLVGISVLIIGILLGYLMGRRTVQSIDKNFPNSNQ